MALRSILFIIIGVIYLIYAGIFTRWIWKGAIAESLAKKYRLLIRILGGILVLVGIILAL